MASCDYCGTTILFGGVKTENFRFCNEKCHQQGVVLAVADQVPADALAEQVNQIRQGSCPKCGGEGPIDVHTSHVVWSALVLTSWNSRHEVCCRSCGVKAKLGGALSSGILGWWGFPWGILATPVQVGRNVLGIFTQANPTKASPQFEKMVRMDLANQFMESRREQESEA